MALRPTALDEIDFWDLDMFTEGDPHAAWTLLREQAPVWWHDRPGGEPFWCITRYDDARAVHAEPVVFSSQAAGITIHDDVSLARHLAACPIRRHTAHTVTDAADLREILRTVRQQGWCLVDQELEEGLISIAVPLRNQRGRVLAAMNVSTHASRTAAAEVASRYLPVLQHAARRIAAALP